MRQGAWQHKSLQDDHHEICAGKDHGDNGFCVQGSQFYCVSRKKAPIAGDVSIYALSNRR
jgi:hypothetical protein